VIRDPGSEIRDPGSGKNLFRIPDAGVKKHPIPDPNTDSNQVFSNPYPDSIGSVDPDLYFGFGSRKNDPKKKIQ
jgi:hypothetical protein